MSPVDGRPARVGDAIHPPPAAARGQDTTTPHVLMIGPTATFPERIRLADVDARVTLLCRQRRAATVASSVAHVVAVPDDAPVASWIRAARTEHLRHPVTRVVAFGELDQDVAAAVGEALAVPATRPRTVEAVHDKEVMRRRLREAGVDPTPASRVATADELAVFVSRHDRSVVKPVAGAGSAGVSIVERVDQAEAAFDRASHPYDGVPDLGVLVEPFHRGPQYSVEAFSEHGDHQVVAVVRKYSDPETLVELGHVVPADLDPVDDDACRSFVHRALDALGVTDGPTHSEIVLTADGPRLIETHVRLAGDDIPELVRRSTGVDLAACAAAAAVGQPVLAPVRRLLGEVGVGQAAAVWFALPPVGGRVVELRGTDAAGEVAPGDGTESVTVSSLLDPGDDISTPLNSDSRVAAVLVTSPRADQALASARRRADAVRVVVELPSCRPTELL